MEPTAPGSGPKPSKVEAVKVASQYLKAHVADELGNGQDHFSEDAASILKFHGSYQQDDRDLRTQLKREKKDKAYQFMIRVRIVGGKLTADQFLACHELARTIGNGTLRITTRQEFQLHGVLKGDLSATIRRINEALLSTLAACGDVERNVLCCPAPVHDSLRDQLQRDAHRWAAHAAPRSSSYWEIWLDGEKIESLPPAGPSQVPTPADDAVEPLYGKAYLPRKFKTAFAFPEDNCTDIHANDLGYLAVVEGKHIAGYNVLVGGGLGMTPSARRPSRSWPFRSAMWTGRASSRSARACSRSFETSATGRIASERGSSTSSTTGAFRLSAPGSRNIWATGSLIPSPSRSPTSTTTWAGETRETGSFSWAFPSRTGASRTMARCGSSAAFARSSRNTGCQRGSPASSRSS